MTYEPVLAYARNVERIAMGIETADTWVWIEGKKHACSRFATASREPGLAPDVVVVILDGPVADCDMSACVYCRPDSRGELHSLTVWDAAEVPDDAPYKHTGGGFFDVVADGRSVQLDLRHVQGVMGIADACLAFIECDPGRFVFAANGNTHALGLVWDNLTVLRERDIFEGCLAEAWIATRTTNAKYEPDEIEEVFSNCDRDRLQAASGSELPAGDTFILYRGVAGNNIFRRPDGLSWTDDLDRAGWFASRFSLPNPEILTAEVAREDIFMFCDGRNEREFVTRPRRVRSMGLSPEEIASFSRKIVQK